MLLPARSAAVRWEAMKRPKTARHQPGAQTRRGDKPAERVRALGACLALCSIVQGCGAAPSLKPNLVLITVDALRADHLGIYGYFRDTSPNIDRWFTDSRVYQRAYATEAATAPSVASILTGRLPQRHRVRLF